MRSSAASSEATLCVNRCPCAESTITLSFAAPDNRSSRGATCILSKQSKIGSGFRTMPSPPPNGRSSTVRCRSCVNSRRSCTSIFTKPISAARRVIPCSRGPRKKSGKMVTMSACICEPKTTQRNVNLRGPGSSSSFPLRLRILLLLFRTQGRVNLQHAFRKPHAHFLASQIHGFQIRLSERHIELLATRARHNQQRRFAGPELHVLDLSDLAISVENRASDEIADVIPPLLKPRALNSRNLQLRSDQRLSVRHRIDARKLQNQQALVRPQAFNFHFVPRVTGLI